MRSLLLASEVAYTANSTVNSTPILLIAANVGSVYGGQAAVPGEDIAFSSDGTACVAIALEGVTSGAGDTINVQVSNNYYADSGSGESFTTAKSFSPGSLSTKSKTVYLDRVQLGEAVRLQTISTHTGAVGTVSAYLLND